MGGFGLGFGAFMQGYQNTMLQRHAEREKQFSQFMETAKMYRDQAERERAKPVWNETLIRDAEISAQKYEQQAEKAMNQKIGGLTKIAGMFKNALGIGGGGAAPSGPMTPGPETPAAMPRPAALGPEPSAPAPGPSYGTGTGAPALDATQPGGSQPPTAFLPSTPELTSPPGGTPKESTVAGAPAAAAKPEPAGVASLKLPKGYTVSPVMTATQSLEEEKLRKELKLRNDAALTHASELAKQDHDRLIQEWNEEHEPALKAAGVKDKDIQAAKMNWMTQGKVKMPSTTGKVVMGKNPVTGSDGKDYYQRWMQDPSGELTELEPVSAGKTAAMRNMSARFQQAVDVYKKAHPEAEDEDATAAVAQQQAGILENKAKLAGLHVVREEGLIKAREMETQWKEEAQKLKAKGGMNAAQALNTLRHFDSIAQNQLFGSQILANKMAGMTGDEIVEMITERSKDLLRAAGFDRDQLMKLSTGKEQPTLEQKAQEARQGLVQPPVSGVVPGAATPAGGQKTGGYKPKK